jgi:hypothetical protein
MPDLNETGLSAKLLSNIQGAAFSDGRVMLFEERFGRLASDITQVQKE